VAWGGAAPFVGREPTTTRGALYPDGIVNLIELQSYNPQISEESGEGTPIFSQKEAFERLKKGSVGKTHQEKNLS
jgi:hypothetical protein